MTDWRRRPVMQRLQRLMVTAKTTDTSHYMAMDMAMDMATGIADVEVS